VQSYPDGGRKEQIATGGVQLCWWGHDGKSFLLLKRDQTLWRVKVDLNSSAPSRIGTPEQVGTFLSTLIEMDLAPAGDRFLALVPERGVVNTITVVQGWRAAVK
jgi:hypothetical protein